MIRTDPVEREIELGLTALGFQPQPDGPGLDFENTSLGFSIECKRFYSPRLEHQVKDRSDVVVIIGIEAARAFRELLEELAARRQHDALQEMKK